MATGPLMVDMYPSLHVQLAFAAGKRRGSSGADPLLHHERPHQCVYDVSFVGDSPAQSVAAAFHSLRVKNYYCAHLSVLIPSFVAGRTPSPAPVGAGDGGGFDATVPGSPSTTGLSAGSSLRSPSAAAGASWVTVLRHFPLMRNANLEDDAQEYTTITADDVREHGRAWGIPDAAALLSAAALWQQGLRLVVTQPSSMWGEFRLEAVRARHRIRCRSSTKHPLLVRVHIFSPQGAVLLASACPCLVAPVLGESHARAVYIVCKYKHARVCARARILHEYEHVSPCVFGVCACCLARVSCRSTCAFAAATQIYFASPKRHRSRCWPTLSRPCLVPPFTTRASGCSRSACATTARPCSSCSRSAEVATATLRPQACSSTHWRDSMWTVRGGGARNGCRIRATLRLQRSVHCMPQFLDCAHSRLPSFTPSRYCFSQLVCRDSHACRDSFYVLCHSFSVCFVCSVCSVVSVCSVFPVFSAFLSFLVFSVFSVCSVCSVLLTVHLLLLL
jgi:hypothetical protein